MSLAIFLHVRYVMSFTITVPDKANRFILQLAETKRSIKHLHFMAYEFRITYLQKSQ